MQHLDTMELWKFGDYKHFTSLDLLAAIFGIPTSKNDMDGSRVNHVYHKENDLQKISDYCRGDVVVLAQLFLKLLDILFLLYSQLSYKLFETDAATLWIINQRKDVGPDLASFSGLLFLLLFDPVVSFVFFTHSVSDKYYVRIGDKRIASQLQK